MSAASHTVLAEGTAIKCTCTSDCCETEETIELVDDVRLCDLDDALEEEGWIDGECPQCSATSTRESIEDARARDDYAERGGF